MSLCLVGWVILVPFGVVLCCPVPISMFVKMFAILDVVIGRWKSLEMGQRYNHSVRFSASLKFYKPPLG